jgi:hypothetical protein
VNRVLTSGATVGIANLLSLALTSFAAIGAPPSHVSEHAGVWLALEPLILPLLIAAPLLTLSGLFVGLVSPGVSGWLCIAGLSGSWLGVMIGSGLEGRATPSEAMILLCVWAVPAFIALDGVRHDRTEGQSADVGGKIG